MSIARSYARALFESILETKSTTPAEAEQDLRVMSEAITGSREARVALLGPATGSKEKAAAVAKIAEKAGTSLAVNQFLQLMARKERLAILPEVAQAFITVRVEADGGVLGQIVSADPMGADDVETIAQAFGKKLGKKITFQTSTDGELLAGIKVMVNGITYDGTLRAQLQRLRDRVMLGV